MSTIATSSDRILLQIVAGTAGEEEWRSLIERHGKSMRRAAMLATGSESLMDDAVQEALLQLPRCSGRFRPRAGDVEVQVSRWLQCLTSNCALALRRAEKRRHRRESIHAEIAMSARSMPDDPRSEQLARAFEGLSERERHVLLLCHVEGLDHHGLAAALVTNATVARKRLSRAHERLRSTLVRQGCMTSMLPMVAKLDAFGHVPLPPQPTVLWVKAAATGTSPMLTTTATLVPGGAFAMSLTAIVTVPILAVSIAVGSVIIAVKPPAPSPAPQVVANPPHATGKIVTIGNGSGMLEYPNAQTTLKLDPGDTLVIAPGTYLGLSLGNLAGTADAPITVTGDAKTLFTSPGGRSDIFTNISFVHFDNFHMEKADTWVITGASHDLRFTKFVATKAFSFHPYDANKVFNGRKDSTFYNFTWENCSFGDEDGPYDGSAISSSDWSPVSNLKSVQLDFEVSHCSFKNFDHGISAGVAVSMDKSFNLKIHDCTFSNIGYSKFIVGHDADIAGSGYFKVFNNTFSHHWANDVRMFPMKLNALGYDGKYAVSSYYNNISFEKRKYPIFEQNGIRPDDLAKSSGYFSATGSEIYFNTVYRSRRGTMTSDPYRGILVDVYAPNVTIKYNLIIDPECDAPFDPTRNYVYLLGAGPQTGIVSEGNLVCKTWEEAGLIDKVGFVPSATSPARNAVKGRIDFITKDHNGNDRYAGASADVGAVERQKGDK